MIEMRKVVHDPMIHCIGKKEHWEKSNQENFKKRDGKVKNDSCIA